MKQKEFTIRSLILLIILALQFILGMILNLFSTLPDKHPGNGGGNNYFVRSLHSYGWAITIGGGVTLFLHVLVATGLLVGSIILLVRAITSHNKSWIWISALGLLGIFMAFGNGLSFLDFNKDVSSFLMACGFIIATVAYGIGLSLTHTTKSPAR